VSWTLKLTIKKGLWRISGRDKGAPENKESYCLRLAGFCIYLLQISAEKKSNNSHNKYNKKLLIP